MKGLTVCEAPLAEMKCLILKLTLKIKINCLPSLFNSFALTPLNSLLFPKVFLLPSVLAQKRMWNPKYPICIQLTRGAKSQEDEGGRREESRGSESGAESASPKPRSSKHDHELPTVLYLFGRTGREKEEWFRHFLFASMDTEREKERNRQSKYVSSTRGMRHIVNALGICNI